MALLRAPGRAKARSSGTKPASEDDANGSGASEPVPVGRRRIGTRVAANAARQMDTGRGPDGRGIGAGRGRWGGARALHPGPPFDGRYAYRLTKLQVDAGPRPAGSATQRAVAERLVKLLPAGRFEAIPGGLRNIVGAVPGRLPAILVVAHYDTTDVPGYLGANNSAAGVGAVIAIARALAGDPRRPWAAGRSLPAHRRRGGADRPHRLLRRGPSWQQGLRRGAREGDRRGGRPRLHRVCATCSCCATQRRTRRSGRGSVRPRHAPAPAPCSRPARRARCSTTTRRSSAPGSRRST